LLPPRSKFNVLKDIRKTKVRGEYKRLKGKEVILEDADRNKLAFHSWAWWCIPIVSATQLSETGRS
jgi:hypothetical protein